MCERPLLIVTVMQKYSTSVTFVTENMLASCAVVSILRNHVTVLLNLQTCCVRILMIFCHPIPLLSISGMNIIRCFCSISASLAPLYITKYINII